MDDEIKTGILFKVVWYLPLIPRLKRLFANPREAKRLRWHHDERIADEYLRHPKDGAQWESIAEKHKHFAMDPRSIWLGECTDGMNPFGDMSTKHSTWPVLLCIYNLAPWLCMKKKYIMMSMIIQGPKQPGNDIDIYFRLLVEEPLTLWVKEPGVKCYDAYKKEIFDLHALLLHTIQDMPALGNMSGQKTRGDVGCVTCMDRTASRFLPNSHKTMYLHHRRFLRRAPIPKDES